MTRPEPPPAEDFARAQGVSLEAVQLLRSIDLIDLHIDTLIPPRLPLVRYDVTRRHDKVFLGGRFFGHLDLPRVLDGGLTGAMWSLTTNPFRRASRRWALFQRNLARAEEVIAGTGGAFRIARTAAEYHAARRDGAHAVMLAIQGGNAVQAAPEGIASVALGRGALPPGPHPITRVTLVHLTNSAYGITSSPFRLWKGKRGLTSVGRDFVAALDHHRIFVDLAHVNRQGFWDAVDAHDKGLPLIATHTGVTGVKPHWRNLDDAQVKAIADSGGVVGIIFSQAFLKVRNGPRDAGMVVDHMEHVIKVAGEDAVALGTDYDGAIVPPPDLRSGVSYVRLVQKMLDRGWSEARIRKALGQSFLASFARLRPG